VGSTEEEYKWFDQQGERVKSGSHRAWTVSGKHRPRQVSVLVTYSMSCIELWSICEGRASNALRLCYIRAKCFCVRNGVWNLFEFYHLPLQLDLCMCDWRCVEACWRGLSCKLRLHHQRSHMSTQHWLPLSIQRSLSCRLFIYCSICLQLSHDFHSITEDCVCRWLVSLFLCVAVCVQRNSYGYMVPSTFW